MRQRVRLRIDGGVQGVGFRPHVYRLANALSLGGFVRNEMRGVLVEVEGAADVIDQFAVRVSTERPSLATIDRMTRERVSPNGDVTFTIRESERGENEQRAGAVVCADVATCAECIEELFDPNDRRFRYPFLNCTNCGPRFSIIRGVPYDRAMTTMSGFDMCAACVAEYRDPGNRRFHAQPNACRVCGPTARLIDPAGVDLMYASGQDAIAVAAAACRSGAIVAIKGIGGYHIACAAKNERAVRRLRERKVHHSSAPLPAISSSSS